MMGKIIVIRHAESVANTKGIYQGQTYDTDLSALGKKQAWSLAEKLANEKIDRILSSPLKRTIQTAQVISKTTDVTVEIEKAIVETNHGEWEGKSENWVKGNYPDEFRVWKEKPYKTKFPNGEYFVQTDDRIKKFLVTEKFFGTMVLVTHDNIIRLMICLAKDVSVNRMWEIELDSAGMTEFEIDEIGEEKRLVLTKMNIIGHIEKIRSSAFHAL